MQIKEYIQRTGSAPASGTVVYIVDNYSRKAIVVSSSPTGAKVKVKFEVDGKNIEIDFLNGQRQYGGYLDFDIAKVEFGIERNKAMKEASHALNKIKEVEIVRQWSAKGMLEHLEKIQQMVKEAQDAVIIYLQKEI